jgi:hypothetical protein
MFNILHYRGNARQNDIEIPSHPCQNGYHQENKQILAKMWGKKNPVTLSVEM